MKKAYSQPECVVVELNIHSNLMQGSPLEIHTGSDAPQIESESDFMSKENKSVWDEEW